MKKIFLTTMLAAATLFANAQNAYLLLANSVNDLPSESSEAGAEDPEIQAARWFRDTFVDPEVGAPTGEFIHLADLATLNPATTKVLWVNVDRVGLANLAAVGIDNAAVNAIKAYVEAGGNLLLTKQASMINYDMRRVGYAPTWGNGGYGQGGDLWTINAHLGIYPNIPQDFDRRGHAVFAGVATTNTNNAFDYEGVTTFFETIPMVGAVQRTDNNNMWIDFYRKDPVTGGQMPETEDVTHYVNNDPQRLIDFEGDWNCQVLAVWGHVNDFCAGTIIEWFPEANFQGKIITIGAAAYQWGKSNDQIANIKKITGNAINYLGNAAPTAVRNQVEAAKVVKTIENGQVVIIKNGVRYNALGATL